MSKFIKPENTYAHLIYNEKNIVITTKNIKVILGKFGLKPRVTLLDLYQQALTHKSYIKKNFFVFSDDEVTKEKQKLIDDGKLILLPERGEGIVPLQDKCYEVPEFLGDSALHFIVADYLYDRFGDQNEGFMTKLRTKLENRETAAILAQELGLSKYILISKQIELKQGRINDKILEEVFEAFLCALYKDSGFTICKELVIKLIEQKIDISSILSHDTNYKDRLLRYYHEMKWGVDPKYVEDSKEGPSHKCVFTISVLNYKNKKIAQGTGKSKKKAEQEAAKKALLYFGVLTNEVEKTD